MTTATGKATEPAPVTLEQNGETVLAGMEIRDKAEVIGVPFRITGLRQHVGERDVMYMQIEAQEVETGEAFTFQDSSVGGVRGQLLDYLASIKRADELEVWIDPVKPILCRRGVRVSTYPTKNDRGKEVTGKTYYLTTAGVRA